MPGFHNVIPIRRGPNDDLIEIAASSVRDRRRAEQYRKGVVHFLRWLGDQNRTVLTAENVGRYREACVAGKLPSRKLHVHMSALSRLAEIMAQLQRLTPSEAAEIHKACQFPPPQPSASPTLRELGFPL